MLLVQANSFLLSLYIIIMRSSYMELMDIKIYELLARCWWMGAVEIVIKQEQNLDIPSCLCIVILTHKYTQTHNTWTHKVASLSMGHWSIPEERVWLRTYNLFWIIIMYLLVYHSYFRKRRAHTSCLRKLKILYILYRVLFFFTFASQETT